MITAKEVQLLYKMHQDCIDIPQSVWDGIRKAASDGQWVFHWHVPYYNHELYLPVFRKLGYTVEADYLGDDYTDDNSILLTITWID